MADAPTLSLDTGTIMAAPRTGAGGHGEDFFQITRIIHRGTVELRQIVTDTNGNPVPDAFVAPAFTAAVTVQIHPDRSGTVWGNPNRHEDRP